MKKVLYILEMIINIPAVIFLIPFQFIFAVYITRNANNDIERDIIMNKFYKKNNLEIRVTMWFISICFYSWLIFK